MSAKTVQDFLYRECGLKGLSGISNDVRELQFSADPRAAFALDYFCYRVGLNAGMLAAALGGIDAFVFTAGIGENSAAIRAHIAARLGWLGAVLDPQANALHASRISAPLCHFNSSRAIVFLQPDRTTSLARASTVGSTLRRSRIPLR
jgi:acetate kinase